MSFPRAPRFTDVADKTPPVGSYNPLLKAHTPAPKFSSSDRFRPGTDLFPLPVSCSSAAVEPFKVPKTRSCLQRDKLQNRLCEMTGHLEERDALISKLTANREHLIRRIEYLEKNLQAATQKLFAKKESISMKTLQCREASSGAQESLAECEATEALTEMRLSKGTAELKEEIEKLIADFRNDDANSVTSGSESPDLTREKDLEHAFEKLCLENEKLLSTVSELQCEVQALKEHHEDIEIKHAELIEQTSNHENEKSKWQQKFEEITIENKTLKANVNCFQAENSRLESVYSSITVRYEEIESQLDEVRCENACLRSSLRDQDSEITVLEQHKQDMLEQLTDAEQELSSRLSDLESLHSRNKELSSIKMNLEQELKTTKDALCALEEEKRTTERDFAKLLEDKNVLEESSRSYLAMHAELEKELSKNMHDLEISHTEAKLLSDKNCSLAKELSAAISLYEVTLLKKGELEKSLDDLSKEKTTVEEHMASVTAALKSAEASLNQVNAELLKLRRELSESENESGNLRKEKADLLDKVATIEEQLKIEQTISDNLRIENGELQGRNLLLEQEVLMSAKSADELAAEKTRIETVSLAMAEEKERLEEELGAIRGRNEELHASHTSLQVQLSAAHAQLSDAEMCKQQLQEELALTQEAQLEAARDALHKDQALRSLESENRDLAQAYFEQQNLHSKLEMQLAALQVSTDLLQAQNAELQVSSDATKQQLLIAERRANKYKLVCGELDHQKRDLSDQIKQLSEELVELRDGMQVAARKFSQVMGPRLSRCLSLESSLSSISDICSRQVASLAEQLKAMTAEAKKWKLNFEALQLRVAPFEDQLALYEMEKELLERRNEATESELCKLHRKVSEMMGHQNHKQKIHYLSNLLEERNEYKREVYTLREKMLKQMKEIRKLEVLLQQRGCKSVLERSAKENLEPPT